MALAHLVAGRYDLACQWAKQARLANRTINQHTDSSLPARLWPAAFLKYRPQLRSCSNLIRVCTFRTPMSASLSAEDIARCTDGLRRAGLPE
jgi:hypothetical protein